MAMGGLEGKVVNHGSDTFGHQIFQKQPGTLIICEDGLFFKSFGKIGLTNRGDLGSNGLVKKFLDDPK